MTLSQFICCGQNLGLGQKNLATTDINYHIYLQGETVENFMTLVDLQILVKRYVHINYEPRIFTQKEFAFPTDILSSQIIK